MKQIIIKILFFLSCPLFWWMVWGIFCSTEYGMEVTPAWIQDLLINHFILVITSYVVLFLIWLYFFFKNIDDGGSCGENNNFIFWINNG